MKQLTIILLLFLSIYSCKKDSTIKPVEQPPQDSIVHHDGSVGFYLSELNNDSMFWWTAGATIIIDGIDTTNLGWVYTSNRCRSPYGYTFTGKDSTYHYHAFKNAAPYKTWSGTFTLTQDCCFAILLKRSN